MNKQPYSEFVSFFGQLNPYELDHLCEALHARFKELQEKSDANTPITAQNIKDVLTKAMRDLRVAFAENRMTEAQIQLDRAKAATFMPLATEITEFDPEGSIQLVKTNPQQAE